jgi:hypothetical protein
MIEGSYVLQRVITDARAGREVILSWSELESSLPGEDIGGQWKRLEEWALENRMWFVKGTTSQADIDSEITFYYLSFDAGSP